MVGRGILDGDYVMISPSARAKDGDIVGARFGDVATVKTLAHRGATIVLEPANDRREVDGGRTAATTSRCSAWCAACFVPYWEHAPGADPRD